MHNCDYCWPAQPAKWQGTDKTARNTRHAKPTKYACDMCRHFLSNPPRIGATRHVESEVEHG